MQLRISVDTGDGPTEVTALPWHIMLWERRAKTKVSRIAADGLGMDDIAYLAYEATRSSGSSVPAKFDDWARTVVALEVIGDDAAPFPPAPSDGS